MSALLYDGPLAEVLGEESLDPFDSDAPVMYERRQGPIRASHWAQSIYEPPPQLSFNVISPLNVSVPAAEKKQAQQEFSDRLKYLICSSTLLSPTITLHDAQSPTVPSSPESTRDVDRLKLIIRATLSCGSLLFATQFIKALRACPSLVFAGVLFSFTQLPFDSFRSKLNHDETHQDLMRLIEELIQASQTADITVDAALSKIKEMECVSRGFGLCTPLPPISRLELSTFQITSAEEQPMRAMALREAVNQALVEARSVCSDASRELEDYTNTEELPSLLTMYNVISDCPPSPLPSPTFRDRRHRNSWHPTPVEVAPSSPIRSADPRRRSLTSNNSLRNSWSPSITRRHSKDLSASSGSSGLGMFISGTTPASAPILQHEFLQPAFDENSSSTPRKQKKSRPLSLSHPPSAIPMRANNKHSLNALRNQFEDLHKERRRVLCCFLALSSTASAKTQATKIARSIASQMRSMTTSVQCTTEDTFPAIEEGNLPGAFTQATPLPHLRKRMSFLSTTRSTKDTYAPLDTTHGKKKEYERYEGNVQAIGQSLRTIAAKLNVAGEDLKSALDSNGTGAERVLAIHESMKGDLESLVREWEDSRLALRKMLLPPATSTNRGTSVPEEEEEELNLYEDDEPDLSVSSTQRTSSIFSAETPELGSPLLFAQAHDFQSFSLLPPFGEEQEEIFEAISGAEERLSGQRLTRVERIRLAKEKREESTEAKASGVAQPMINELKGVISALKVKREERKATPDLTTEF